MNLDFRFYWKLLLHRFPVMALMFTICLGLAAFTAIRMPETFDTSARLLVEEPQIPANMIASTVRTDAIEQLDIIQQRLLTRSNLIDIANRFEVYDDLREVEPDLIVERMQEDTNILTSTGRNSAIIMSISFEARNGQIAANVVNEYVTLVLEANTSSRVDRAENTREFFDQEANRLSDELDIQNAQIAAFKTENASALPENQTYRLDRQSLLQERQARLETDLRTIEAQRANLQKIFEETGQFGAAADQERPPTAEEQQLLVAKTDLSIALSTYTAANPRVIRLQSIVDRLEAIVATQINSASAEAANEDPATTAAEAIFRSNISEMDGRIEAIKADIASTVEELGELEQAISASIANGIQLSSMDRDFENIQTRYNAAIANLSQAQVGERIESTSQGQRISVIESANVPRLPTGPDRPRVVALGGALGIGLAGGFFVLLELLNRTVRRPAELFTRFDVVPLATIPYLESRSRKAFRRLLLIIGSIIAIVGVPIALWYFDRNYMPLDLLVQSILSKIGIM